jgi:hypothetical protein
MCFENLASDLTRLSSLCISRAMSSEHGSKIGKCTRVFVEFRKLVPRPSVINHDLIARACLLHCIPNSYRLDILIQAIYRTI